MAAVGCDAQEEVGDHGGNGDHEAHKCNEEIIIQGQSQVAGLEALLSEGEEWGTLNFRGPPALSQLRIRRAALDPVPQPLQQGLHGAAAHPGVAADLQGHQPRQALQGLETEEGQAPVAEVQVSELHQALEGLGVHPAQPRVVAQVDVHEAVGFLEHVGRHVAEVVVAQIQVCQALGVEEEARGQLHQGVVTQIQHPELHVAREVAGRHGRDAVVGQAEVASVHRQVWGHGEQPLAAAIHHLVMARTEDRAASAGLRAHGPGCQEEGDQQHSWVGGPRPGQLGPGVTHLRQLATALLKGAHWGWGCVHESRVGGSENSYIRARAPEGGASGHVVSWLSPEPLSTRGLPR